MGLILLFLQVQCIVISYQKGIHLFIDGLVFGGIFLATSSPRKKPKISYVQTVTYALLHDEHIFIFRQVSQ